MNEKLRSFLSRWKKGYSELSENKGNFEYEQKIHFSIEEIKIPILENFPNELIRLDILNKFNSQKRKKSKSYDFFNNWFLYIN